MFWENIVFLIDIFLFFSYTKNIVYHAKGIDMKKQEIKAKNPIYYLHIESDFSKIAQICQALSSVERIKILHALLYKPKSMTELSKELNIPNTTLTRYVEDLAQAKLIHIYYKPAKKGKLKYCAQNLLSCKFVINDSVLEDKNKRNYVIEMPIGLYSSYDINKPCGMNGSLAPLEFICTPKDFLLPQRTEAELLWFDYGKLDYDFPLPELDYDKGEYIHSISISFEACSEVTNYNNNWPSDITIWLDGTQILTFCSPGDFGGTRGMYTPSYWPINCTQFGELNKITISNDGVFRNNLLIKNNITLKNFDLDNKKSIRFSIGVLEDADHRGGINLFGANFGNYKQAIKMIVKTKINDTDKENN